MTVAQGRSKFYVKLIFWTDKTSVVSYSNSLICLVFMLYHVELIWLVFKQVLCSISYVINYWEGHDDPLPIGSTKNTGGLTIFSFRRLFSSSIKMIFDIFKRKSEKIIECSRHVNFKPLQILKFAKLLDLFRARFWFHQREINKFYFEKP